MENLLTPDYGVLALTLVNFGILVWLLKKFAWGPIIGALEKREEQIRTDKETAQTARQSAEQLKQELDEKLANLNQEAANRLAAIVKTAETQKEQLVEQAKQQAANLLAQAQAQIQAGKEKALADVRNEIAQLSVLATSRLIDEQLSPEKAAQVVDQVLTEVRNK